MFRDDRLPAFINHAGGPVSLHAANHVSSLETMGLPTATKTLPSTAVDILFISPPCVGFTRRERSAEVGV